MKLEQLKTFNQSINPFTPHLEMSKKQVLMYLIHFVVII